MIRRTRVELCILRLSQGYELTLHLIRGKCWKIGHEKGQNVCWEASKIAGRLTEGYRARMHQPDQPIFSRCISQTTRSGMPFAVIAL
jgi:hypothetical protein